MENYWRKGVKTGGEGWKPRHGRLVRKMGINLMKRMWLLFKGLWKEMGQNCEQQGWNL